ncbi:NAD-dependent epimerase/dehydratase family protein [Agromyces sp. CCNWLW203]|uniref:NAD-dependent epimerase/dehydratase family protein n=1 Tax=Agromyces sp. CCNWLW203 TaxID=3112842 RepID=UPI002F96D90F
MTATHALVVGGGGPLGAAVAAELASRRLPAAVTRRTGRDALDISKRGDVVSALRSIRPRTVIYLANPGVEDLEEAVVVANVDHIRRFALDAARHGVERIVFASSAAVYGTTWTEPVAEEDVALGPGMYASLKRRSEEVLREVAGSTPLSAISLRIFNIYGPGFSRSLITRLATGEPRAVLQVSDSFVRDYIHGDDVARAMAIATEATSPGFRILNIGTGIATDNVMLSRFAAPGSYSVATSPSAPSYCVARVDRARRELGFDAEWSVDRYLAEAAARRF